MGTGGEFRHAVLCFEQLPLTRAILSPPVVITPDEWRRYAEEEPLSRNDLAEAAGKLNVKRSHYSEHLQDGT